MSAPEQAWPAYWGTVVHRDPVGASKLVGTPGSARRPRASQGTLHCKAELQQLTMPTEATSHWKWGVASSYQTTGFAGLARGLPERSCYCKPWTDEQFQICWDGEELLVRQLANLSQLWSFPKFLLPQEQRAHPTTSPRLTPLHSLQLLFTLDAGTDMKSEIITPREASLTHLWLLPCQACHSWS